jgi:hypothetical protein
VASFAVARRHARSLEPIGRAGWVAKGLLYASLAFLVVGVATTGGGGGGEQADQQGALRKLADTGPSWILWPLIAGLVLYALWRATEALLPADGSPSSLVERGGRVVSALVYGTLAVFALRLATSGGSGGSQGSTESWTGSLLESGWGRWLVGAAGVVLLGVAVHQAGEGLSRSFLERLATAQMGAGERRLIERLGLAGHLARAVVFALAGWFVVHAAWTVDPEEATGLDHALRSVADARWGPAVLLATAVGLLAYAAYCVVSARHQQLSAPD